MPAPMPPTSGATPRKAPPAVATIFPPLRKPRKSGRQCPSIAARAREHARRRGPTSFVATSAGTKPFAVSRKHGRQPELRPVDAPDVRRADVAASLRPDVLAAEDPHEPVAPRHRAAARSRRRRGRGGQHRDSSPARPGCRTARPSRSRRPSRGCRRTRRCTRRGRSGSRGSTRARRRRARRAASRSRPGTCSERRRCS